MHVGNESAVNCHHEGVREGEGKEIGRRGGEEESGGGRDGERGGRDGERGRGRRKGGIYGVGIGENRIQRMQTTCCSSFRNVPMNLRTLLFA